MIMKMLSYIITLMIGIALGVLSVGVAASRSYSKGRQDERDNLPTDISEFLNAQTK